jgi:hypothetical protein
MKKIEEMQKTKGYNDLLNMGWNLIYISYDILKLKKSNVFIEIHKDGSSYKYAEGFSRDETLALANIIKECGLDEPTTTNNS